MVRPPIEEALKLLESGHFYQDYNTSREALATLNAAKREIETFVRRVEAGEIRSKRTYAAFVEILRGTP